MSNCPTNWDDITTPITPTTTTTTTTAATTISISRLITSSLISHYHSHFHLYFEVAQKLAALTLPQTFTFQVEQKLAESLGRVETAATPAEAAAVLLEADALKVGAVRSRVKRGEREREEA
jgi:hypothetical protein